MKRIGTFIACLALLPFCLQVIDAQDKKKDPDKTDKKEIDKSDKKDAKKEDPRVKLVYGAKFRTKILSIKPESSRELVIEVQDVDPSKVAQVQQWSVQRQQQLAQRQQQLAQQLFQANNQKDFNARRNALIQYERDVNNFQVEVAKFQQELAYKQKTQIYSTKNLEVRGAENAYVRTMGLPIEFDDAGFQKKFTPKELEARRDKTGLPGFPSDFDAIKPGQYVDIYMAKVDKKVTPKKKDPDAEEPKMTTPEYMMIVIVAEAK